MCGISGWIGFPALSSGEQDAAQRVLRHRGPYDEGRFVDEFFDRCRLLRFHPWGYLPFLHLFHAPQPGKLKPVTANAYLERVLRIPAAPRAELLAASPSGSSSGTRTGILE